MFRLWLIGGHHRNRDSRNRREFLKAARAVNGKKPLDASPQLAEWAAAWDAAIEVLTGVAP